MLEPVNGTITAERVFIVFDLGSEDGYDEADGIRVGFNHAMWQAMDGTIFLTRIESEPREDVVIAKSSGIIVAENYRKELTKKAAVTFARRLQNMDGWSLLTNVLYGSVDTQINFNLMGAK
jgi:tRNA(Phe) wybutosine-synthesizing methylase Tyw3